MNKCLTVSTAAPMLLALLLPAINAGCSRNSDGAVAPQAVSVKVVSVKQQDVPIYREWIGTLDGLVNADIKAQVSGYLVEQAYTEGSFVRKGQLLFQIDPRPFEAVLAQKGQRLQRAHTGFAVQIKLLVGIQFRESFLQLA